MNFAAARNVLLGMVCLIAATGCPRSETPTPSTDNLTEKVSLQLPDVPEKYTPQQIKAAMENLEPFSQPFEQERLKLLVVWERIRLREGVEGFSPPPLQPSKDQTAYADPQTGQIAWRALTCFNPKCPGTGKGGGPLLFVRPYKNTFLGPDGKLVMGPGDDSDLEKPCVCPACGLTDFIRTYDPPESELRSRQLAQEMQSIYQVLHEAEKSGQVAQFPGRTPTEVITNKSELPKLFLVPDPAQVVVEGRLTVPASRGLGKPK